MSKIKVSRYSLQKNALGRISRFQWAALIILLVSLAIGFFFCAAQDLLYSHTQPFYDSMSYYNRLHGVMTTGHQQGMTAAIAEALRSGTVLIPFLVAALIWPLVETSRHVGVWIQMVELIALLGSLLYYFCRIKHFNPLSALLLLVPFLLTACLYQTVGGVSDFRMDLSLYLTFSIAVIWYLIAIGTGRKRDFVVLGLAMVVACLFRATAPVYLMLCLGPLALYEIVFSDRRKQIAIGFGVSTLTAIVGALWFYLLHFEQLYYYYFVWNADANAKLPLAESVQHIELTLKQIGDFVLIWFVAINLILVFLHWRSGKQGILATAGSLLTKTFREMDLRPLWLAIAPVAMLVLRGAGLNPYVGLPAIIGLMLWLLNPIAADELLFKSRRGLISASVVSVLCLLAVAVDGWKQHQPHDYNSMQAHRLTLRTIAADARMVGLQQANFGSTHVYYLNSSSLASAMLFDLPEAHFQSGQTLISKVSLAPSNLFSGVVATANWDQLAGDTPQKLATLVAKADSQIDYLIVPNEATIQFVETSIQFNIINQHQRFLRSHILNSGNWVVVGELIQNNEDETIQIYRNVRRTRLAQLKNTEAKFF